MSKHETGGPAFPVPEHQDHRGWEMSQSYGMTLRDYFAAKAMQTLLGSEYTSQHGLQEGWMSSLAHESYLVADAMLKVREST